MQIITQQEGSVTLVKPLGALLKGDLDDLEKALQQLAQRWVKRVVINLSEMPCIDSAGLELMKRSQQQFGEHGLRMKLCCLNDVVTRIFNLTRLNSCFDIFSDTTTAVRSFL